MYRTLDVTMWEDPKVRSLPTLGKLLFLYLITNRLSHVAGIYYLPEPLIEYDTNIDADTIRATWDLLNEKGLARRDHAGQVVWVVRMFQRQARGEKADIAAARQLCRLHGSDLVVPFLQHYPRVKSYLDKDFLDRVSKGHGWGIDTPSIVPVSVPVTDTDKSKEENVLFPPELDTEQFKAKWTEWCDYRKRVRKKPVSDLARTKQFNKLAPVGEEVALATIDLSIENDWQGLDPEWLNGRTSPKAKANHSTVAAKSSDARRERIDKRAVKLNPTKEAR
jgi:hypothetical protein